jgi:hypothetical protein
MTMEAYLIMTAVWGALMLAGGWYMGSKGVTSIWTTVQTDLTTLKNDVFNLKATVNVPTTPAPATPAVHPVATHAPAAAPVAATPVA